MIKLEILGTTRIVGVRIKLHGFIDFKSESQVLYL
jgi:hypothetical protein